MQWFGKGIGGLIGAFVAGPVGSLVGVLLGHQLDQSLRSGSGSVSEISRLFFETTFEVMGQVAKIDGRVSEDEGQMQTDGEVQVRTGEGDCFPDRRFIDHQAGAR